MKIKIASPTIFDSIVEGPCLRMVVWTQGCIRNCKGCITFKHIFLNGSYEINVSEIIKDMKNSKM